MVFMSGFNWSPLVNGLNTYRSGMNQQFQQQELERKERAKKLGLMSQMTMNAQGGEREGMLDQVRGMMPKSEWLNPDNPTPQLQGFMADAGITHDPNAQKLQGLKLQLTEQKLKNAMRPEAPITQKGADGYLRYMGGEQHGQRVYPDVVARPKNDEVVKRREYIKLYGQGLSDEQKTHYLLTGKLQNGQPAMSEGAASAASFAQMMRKATQNLNSFSTDREVEGKTYYDPTANTAYWDNNAPNIMVSGPAQKYRQAASQWIRAKLRKESGAAIGKDEMEQEFRTFFPQPGDSAEVVQQKAQARLDAERAMIAQSRGAHSQLYPQEQPRVQEHIAAPPAEQRKIGQVYQTPKGPAVWRGNGWEPA